MLEKPKPITEDEDAESPEDEDSSVDDIDDVDVDIEILTELEVDLVEEIDVAEVIVVDIDDELDDVEEDDEEEVPRAKVVTPQRSPMGKDEPPPPFAIGERIILTQNTRPRTGTPVGDYSVGATGIVEAVLSLTAIVRFDDPPQTKEVVAFECLKSASKK